jgi:hypothetical protein
LQKTFAIGNCVVALNKLHKTLVANVDEVNNQKNSPFVYYHVIYI